MLAYHAKQHKLLRPCTTAEQQEDVVVVTINGKVSEEFYATKCVVQGDTYSLSFLARHLNGLNRKITEF